MTKVIYLNFNDLKPEVKEEIFQIAKEKVLEKIVDEIKEKDGRNLKEYTKNWDLDYERTLENLVNYVERKISKWEYEVPYIGVSFDKDNVREEIENTLESTIAETADWEIYKLNYVFNP